MSWEHLAEKSWVIEDEAVTADQRNPGSISEAIHKQLMQPGVLLDRDQPARLFGEAFSQDAGAGTDLHHQVIRAQLRRVEDQIANGRRDEETLRSEERRVGKECRL